MLFNGSIQIYVVVLSFLKALLLIIPLLISVAFFTLAERKILGAIQRRQGPNVVGGSFGMFQPLADGLKLFIKEALLPSSSNKVIFVLAPIITFVISLMGWVVIPYNKYSFFVDINLSLLYIFAVTSLGVYGIIMSGWASNSKYALLGSLRSTAQMISYEVSVGFILGFIALICGSFNLSVIIEAQKGCWFAFLLFPLFLIFFACALAETNRHPFDLPEAEAELVAGYNVEYSGMGFALFSLGEYANMLLMSALGSCLFLGGWLPFFNISFISGSVWFSGKLCFFVILFIFARAGLPRYRYDQLMSLGWTAFLPVSVSIFLFCLGCLSSFNCLPN